MDMTQISRFIAYVLRHHPEEIGITIDYHGAWANTQALLSGISRKYPLTMAQLESIVAKDRKQRYAFSADKTRIRANQGHSIPVDLGLEPLLPPPVLYHGTAEKTVPAILREGLLPMTRQHVHLSPDEKTAKTVGHRHGKPVIFLVDTAQMHRDGFSFFLSQNGVWLTGPVPAKYLTLLSGKALAGQTPFEQSSP